MKKVEDDKSHQFLMGLNDELYANITGQILVIDPLPTLDKIFNMVHQEDSHRHLMINIDVRHETAAAFSASSISRTPVSVKGTCNHCGKYGHEETGYFDIIEYPPSWSSCGCGRGGRSNKVVTEDGTATIGAKEEVAKAPMLWKSLRHLQLKSKPRNSQPYLGSQLSEYSD